MFYHFDLDIKSSLFDESSEKFELFISVYQDDKTLVAFLISNFLPSLIFIH
jgi:hypothetical protein